MSVLNTLERDDVIQSTHMFCMCRSCMAFHFEVFLPQSHKGHQWKAAPKANGNEKSGNGTEHSTEAFPIGHTGELAETQPKAMWFIHNGEGWEGWEKLIPSSWISWSSWHVFWNGIFVSLFRRPNGFLHISQAFLSNAMDLCQDIERSTSKWHVLVRGPGYGCPGVLQVLAGMYQDSVHEAATFWHFLWKTKIRSHPKKNRLIVVFTWNDYTSIPNLTPHHLILKHFYNMT